MEIVTVDKLNQKHIKQINQLFNHPEVLKYLNYSKEDGLDLDDTKRFVLTKKKELKERKSMLWTALEDGEIQGVIEARFFPFTKQRHKLSFGIWVRPDKHRTGIGSKLMEELISYAKTNGYTRIEGEVYCQNKAALGLYKKYGFAIEGKRERATYYYGMYYDDYIVAKLL